MRDWKIGKWCLLNAVNCNWSIIIIWLHHKLKFHNKMVIYASIVRLWCLLCFVCGICHPPQLLNTDFVGFSLFIYCNTKDFCCSSFQEHPPLPPPHTHASESPPKLEPGWPAPSPASKPDADEKFMTVCLENLTFHLKCCCSSDDAPADGAFTGTDLFPTAGVRFREKEGDVSMLLCSSTSIHWVGVGFCLPLPCRCIYIPVNR